MPVQEKEQKPKEISSGERGQRAELPRPETVDQKREEEAQNISLQEQERDETIEGALPVTPPPSAASVATAASDKSEQLRAIERILEANLEQTFWTLPPGKQEEFKRKGEETARTIERLLQAARVHASKILRLIKQWLRVIPHVNRFFLEQESKIKTDKILALHERKSKHD